MCWVYQETVTIGESTVEKSRSEEEKGRDGERTTDSGNTGRIHAELKSTGVECSRNPATSLMRKAGIRQRVSGQDTLGV